MYRTPAFTLAPWFVLAAVAMTGLAARDDHDALSRRDDTELSKFLYNDVVGGGLKPSEDWAANRTHGRRHWRPAREAMKQDADEFTSP